MSFMDLLEQAEVERIWDWENIAKFIGASVDSAQRYAKDSCNKLPYAKLKGRVYSYKSALRLWMWQDSVNGPAEQRFRQALSENRGSLRPANGKPRKAKP